MGCQYNRKVANTINLAFRAMAHTLNCAPSQSALAVALLALLIGSVCQGQNPKSSVTVPESSPVLSAAVNPASIVLELNRAIAILKQGMTENWGNRGRYLFAFEKTPNVDSAGRSIADAKSYVECVLEKNFRNHEVWDEGVPIDAEARLTVTELTKLKEFGEKANGPAQRLNEFHFPPCVSSEHHKITISAGVAIALLKRKIDPIYPADALQHKVSGTVILHAIIGVDGHIVALQIISGPDELRQATLNAVSQWTYHPYRLNDRPVEVETTISVPFSLHR